MSDDLKKLQDQIKSTTGEHLSTESLALVLKQVKEWQDNQRPAPSQAAVMAELGNQFIGDSLVPYPTPEYMKPSDPEDVLALALVQSGDNAFSLIGQHRQGVQVTLARTSNDHNWLGYRTVTFFKTTRARAKAVIDQLIASDDV